jgi:hypothetical protein
MVRSMEVKLNTNVGAVSLRPTSPSKSRGASEAGDSASFDQSADLNQSLQATPQARPEAVDRAQKLIGDVNYPPRETIRRIATLLAMHLDNDGDKD